MFSQILVPYDLSDNAQAAFGHALVLARACGAKLHVTHIVEPPYLAQAPLAMSPTTMAETLRQQGVTNAEQRLSRFVGDLASTHGVAIGSEVVSGWLPDAIVDQAKAVGADLIVMATHGRTGLSRLLLGSVTERVLRSSKCPVLVARGGSALVTPLISRIAVATDFSEHAERALNVAARVAALTGASLTLVHAHPNPIYTDGISLDGDLLRESVEGAEEALKSLAQKHSVNAETRVVMGSPVAALHDYLESNSTDLLVMGTHGRRGLSHALLGSVAEQTVRYATCATLVVP